MLSNTATILQSIASAPQKDKAGIPDLPGHESLADDLRRVHAAYQALEAEKKALDAQARTIAVKAALAAGAKSARLLGTDGGPAVRVTLKDQFRKLTPAEASRLSEIGAACAYDESVDLEVTDITGLIAAASAAGLDLRPFIAGTPEYTVKKTEVLKLSGEARDVIEGARAMASVTVI